MEFLEMEQYVQVYAIELIDRRNDFVKVMLIHRLFYLIYLQELDQHHEREEHEHNFPRRKKRETKKFLLTSNMSEEFSFDGQEAHLFLSVSLSLPLFLLL